MSVSDKTHERALRRMRSLERELDAARKVVEAARGLRHGWKNGLPLEAQIESVVAALNRLSHHDEVTGPRGRRCGACTGCRWGGPCRGEVAG